MSTEDDVEMRPMNEVDTIDGTERDMIDVLPSMKRKALIIMIILVFVVGLSTFGGVTEFSMYEEAMEKIQKARNSPVGIINETTVD